MGFVLTEMPHLGTPALMGASIALYRNKSRNGRVRISLGSVIQASTGWRRGERIEVWRGTGSDAGLLRLARGARGILLSRPNRDCGALELQCSPTRIGLQGCATQPSREVDYWVEDQAVIVSLPAWARRARPDYAPERLLAGAS